MNINDHILIQMINNDLRAKGISDYQLLDEVVTNPTTIKVGANEMVYVAYCYVKSTGNFTIKLSSGTDVTSYNELNTTQKAVGNDFIFESSQITTHFSNIGIKSAVNNGHFFIRYVRVAFSKSHKQ